MYNLTEFLRLSAALNYQLTASEIGSGNILSIILGRKRISEYDKALLLKVLEYLSKAYGQKRRQLGPLAVLHPLRATAMLARAQERACLLDLLSELLHDKLEDILPEDFPHDDWENLEKEFQALIKQVDPTDEWYLMERLHWLTRKKEEETYHAYIERLLDRAHMTPELVRVKLADRLDNTLDMHIEHEDPLEDMDFFSYIFQVMFVNTYAGYRPEIPHPELVPFYGARRLYELFKNTVVLSLVRQKSGIGTDRAAQTLFRSIAYASMEEAQRMILHIFAYHFTDIREQRRLIRNFMGFFRKDGEDTATLSIAEQHLENSFTQRFDPADPSVRMLRLNELYRNKPLMIETAMAFIITFLSFLNDPEYFLPSIKS